MHHRINPVFTIAVLGVLLTTEVVTAFLYSAQALSADMTGDSL